jgi:hypothetical protein
MRLARRGAIQVQVGMLAWLAPAMSVRFLSFAAIVAVARRLGEVTSVKVG